MTKEYDTYIFSADATLREIYTTIGKNRTFIDCLWNKDIVVVTVEKRRIFI